MVFSGMILIIVETLPVILDAVVPMNESRSRAVKVEFEIFLDQEKYFYVYLMQEFMMLMVTFTTIVSTGLLLLAFMRHSCAIYKIAR